MVGRTFVVKAIDLGLLFARLGGQTFAQTAKTEAEIEHL
jgi:hypothetical protein